MQIFSDRQRRVRMRLGRLLLLSVSALCAAWSVPVPLMASSEEEGQSGQSDCASEVGSEPDSESEAMLRRLGCAEGAGHGLLEAVRRRIPPLTSALHKGQAGRVAVVGGSFEYTGAPFYASVSTLKAGGDLAWVICRAEAAVAIKSYSPEIIVLPSILTDIRTSTSAARQSAFEGAASLLSRVHALVLGPGLGRHPGTFDFTRRLLAKARAHDVALVLDGDALFLLSQEPDLILGHGRVLLTPNAAEFKRLFQAVLKRPAKLDDVARIADSGAGSEEWGWAPSDCEAATLSRALGNVTIMQKGAVDIVSNGHTSAFCATKGSNRRCGGQGDVLAGTSGLFMHWMRTAGETPADASVLAALGASALTRTANRLAFSKHARSTTTPDIIDALGIAFQHLYPEQPLAV